MLLRTQLLKLLANGDCHSGEALGAALGVSRMAVWKHLKVLRASGVPIEIKRGKGYRLPDAIELLDRDGILDLVISFSSPTSTGWATCVRTGRGDGTFSEPLLIGDPGDLPSNHLVGDFNGDGRTDIAAVRAGGVEILLGLDAHQVDSTIEGDAHSGEECREPEARAQILIIELLDHGIGRSKHVGVVKVTSRL